MKVILLEDIKGVGKAGDLINSSDGHARNYLLPRKLAVEATKANLHEYEMKKKSEEHKRQLELEAARELAKNIEEQTIEIKVKMGENGRLFGSVTNKEVADALRAQCGLDVDKKKVTLTDPIKTSGEKTAEVKLHAKVTAKLKINIIEE
ncbi:MAG: 50S ribosomal protein L9 [Defluviitaleaceae bacterium]|nr:50S ribosomal protein L9 [Defluviitaleaceae bacterium]